MGAWLYTGPVGRFASFAIDLAGAARALGLYVGGRLREKLRGNPG